MNRDMYGLATTFFCLYRQLSPDNAHIPLSDGSLDRALKKAAEDLPGNVLGSAFHFADTRVGLRCIELPLMEQLACSGGFISYVAPEHTHAHFEITQPCALGIVNGTDSERAFVSRVIYYVAGAARSR